MIRQFSRVAAGAMIGLGLVLGAGMAAAEDLPAILEKKKIVIGVQNDLPPYSLIGDANQPVGLDIDVAEEIGKRLGVDVELVVLTGANRVPYLISNRVDAVVATIGITPERREAIGFTRPYLVFRTVMVAPKDLDVTSNETIGDRVVGVTRGTMMDPLITNGAPAGTNIQRFDDDATTSVALVTGQVDMIPTGEAIVMEVIRQNPARNLEIKYVMASTYAGIGVNKDNTALVEKLDEVVTAMEADGSLGAIYLKWIGNEMPDLPKSLDELN
ncbi:transporter substrate-binding domain-containing protein [Paracoccus sp. IB05]|uniref:transporter substrate-binding domain-containing protein n=1 Tax=Paracoccus sp. IB05 TaxID=2779367 RepID=UPI0018E79313|nr:transporter substrate-binding domain-containing protein [Paracoccus sp. IB05]MBJ2152749.1 transporter substrate-binding domain-containing protein [Paracoccus sp. IB05]